MEFKIFRRKNVIYIQYRFEPDELKLFTASVPGITSLTIYYRIICDSEGNAKKFSKGKGQIQALPLKQAISEAAIKARLLAEEMIKHDLRPTALPGFDAVKIVREGREE
jgi:hypothetical protein